MPAQSPIAVLGAGSFGTAMAIAFANDSKPVTLWGHNPLNLTAIEQDRENRRYLPGVKLPPSITINASLDSISKTHQHYFIVVPSHAFRQNLIHLKNCCDQHGNQPETISWGTKGFEPESGALLSRVAAETFSKTTQFAVITGPSFARELARGLPTTLAVASDHSATAHQVASWLKNPTLKAYTNSDIVGTQVGGAVKNVMAIATGICDGMGLGANARAGLITRGLAELTRMGQALGGQTETFMGLSGLGDLILTCTDDQSRNRRVGLGLGRGKTLAQILTDIGQEAEGVITTKTVHILAEKLDIEMPITEAVYNVLYKNLTPADGVKQLLARELKSEY